MSENTIKIFFLGTPEKRAVNEIRNNFFYLLKNWLGVSLANEVWTNA